MKKLMLRLKQMTFSLQHTAVKTFNEGEVYLAKNAEEALDIILNEDVGLVLMDVVLPGKMG